MIKSCTNNIEVLREPVGYLVIPIIVTLVYCIYEKFIVFTKYIEYVTFCDRTPLAVLWILECIIGEKVSNSITLRYEQQLSETRRFIAFGPALCLLAAIGMIVWFLIFRAFLYYLGKENKN